MNKSIKQEQGAALLLSVVLIMSISLMICLGLVFLTSNSLISTRNKIKSTESYYAAEAGLEDSFLRLKNSMQISSPNTLAVGNNLTIIEISESIGGSRTITSQGNAQGRMKKLSVEYVSIFNEVSFYYGAQVGDGGITMSNGSRIEGNVFSNGDIIGNGEITDTAIVANDGNIIDSIDVGGDAHAYSCTDSNITGTLYYVSGGSTGNCTYSESVEIDSIESQDMPISQEQIDAWKSEAETGGTFLGDYIIAGSETASLGPIKITGNLTIGISSTLTVTGLIYVEGDISVSNNGLVQLNESFGSLSGIIINDGKVIVENGVVFLGSGEKESFLMFLSTNDSLDTSSPAIDVSNNADAAIFYAPDGLIFLHNNINVREATGYQLALDNNAIISYETGLENVNFTSGPDGSQEFKNWKEIE